MPLPFRCQFDHFCVEPGIGIGIVTTLTFINFAEDWFTNAVYAKLRISVIG